MQLDKIFKKARHLKIDEQSKIVIMSDCHRGMGNREDNFMKNKNIFEVALTYYYNRDFTYIELGDGDELWEVKNYRDIIGEHLHTFKQLKKFHEKNRLIMIYGNHDMDKKYPAVLEKYFYYYDNQLTKKREPLLMNLKIYESFVLNYNGCDIFLVHGHQVDFFNNYLWRLSKFLVRYVWRYLEQLGINDPTSAAKNYQVKGRVEGRLEKWSIENNKLVIAGHTHRPIFPKSGQSRYLNDGSCVHPNGITCIEIEKGKVSLVKWDVGIKDGFLSVERSVIAGGEKINYFFIKNGEKRRKK